jgi:hypothetical protein
MNSLENLNFCCVEVFTNGQLKNLNFFLPMEVFANEQLKNNFLFVELFANKQ